MSPYTKKHAVILRDATMTVNVKIRLGYQLSLYAAQKIHLQVQSLVLCVLWNTSLVYKWDRMHTMLLCHSPCTPSDVLPTLTAAALPFAPSTFSNTSVLPFLFNLISSLLFLTNIPLFKAQSRFMTTANTETRNVFVKRAEIAASILKGFCTCFVSCFTLI